MRRSVLFLALVAAIPAVVAFKRVVPRAGDAVPFYGRPAFATNAEKDTAPATHEQIARGRQVYELLCQACHMPDGRGMGTALPPLAGADYLLADRTRAIGVVLHGLSGPITVNGLGYNAAMPALGTMLSDQQVADVLTYVTNSWGNTGDAFTAAQVRAVRGGTR